MRYNLILAFFWLAIGLCLVVLSRTDTGIKGLPTGDFATLLAILAFTIAALKLVRWGSARTNRSGLSWPKASPKRPPEGSRLEYNPEFDFNRPQPITLPTGESTEKR